MFEDFYLNESTDDVCSDANAVYACDSENEGVDLLNSENSEVEKWLCFENNGGDAWGDSEDNGGDAWGDSENNDGDVWGDSENSDGSDWLYSENSDEDDWFDNGFTEIEDMDVDYGDFSHIENEVSKSNIYVDSATDAYIFSMREKGCVDLEYMSEISKIDVDELINKLGNELIWADPDLFEITNHYRKCWVSKEKLLNCNLSRKIKKAIALQKEVPLFAETIKTLEKALPGKVDISEIYAGIGAPWIPTDIICDFVKGLLDMNMLPTIERDKFKGKWHINCVGRLNYISNTFTYGTSKMYALNIIEHKLNTRPIKVFDQVFNYAESRYDSVLNKDATLAANEKSRLIDDMWNRYLHDNDGVITRIEDAFMEYFGFTNVHYDGSYLELPGLNKDVTPYPHQRDAIARIIMNDCTILSHSVGAGKSLEFSAGVHELIRLGIGHKALVVVPNTTLDSFVNMYKYYYSDDKVLAVYPKKHFTPSTRTETLNKIKSDKYQVVIMAYSSFDMLTMSKGYIFDRLDEQLLNCKAHLDRATTYSTKSYLRAEYNRLKKKIDKFKEKYVETETACFDELGFDILVLDEAHNYKNITLDNVAENIIGVHSKGSKKADNALEKIDFLRINGGHIIFSTGTTITNSMADLYVMMRYLQYEELQMLHLDHFNDFVSTFTEQTSDFEVDVDSKNFRFVTRFSRFHNLPELMSLFSQVCDSYQGDKTQLGLPDFEKIDVVVKKSQAQADYIEDIAKRADDIRHRLVKRTEDNLLKLTVDGKQCAIDIRLVKPDAVVTDEDTKIKICANNIAQLYYEYPGTTQIAFCDIGTPKEGFNLYDELKNELILRGLKADEIKFIHEATSESSRAKIEKAFNAGTVRVLIGSTMKLGTGCNVQEKLIAIHHVDIPWRPADMIQREGRLIRQGNTNKQTYIYRYVTEASFDSYTWQLLENKQKFIADFLSASMDASHRSETDCAESVLDYAEIKALAIGNPLIKERVKVANSLEQAKINQRQRKRAILDLQELTDSFPRRLEKLKVLQADTLADKEYYDRHKESVSMDEREALGKNIFEALAGNVMKEENRVLEIYQGFEIILPAFMKSDRPYVMLHRANNHTYSIKMDGDKVTGCSRRIDYVLEHLDNKLQEHYDNEVDITKQMEQAKVDLQKGNEFDDVVEELARKLTEIDLKLQANAEGK